MMYGNYGEGWGGGWMLLMPLGWLLLIGLAVWAVVRLSAPHRDAGADHGARRPFHDGELDRGWDRHRESDRESDRGGDRESPEEILDRRFATGEIDAEEHDRARRQLAEHRGRSASR